MSWDDHNRRRAAIKSVLAYAEHNPNAGLAYDELAEARATFRDRPLHNWASHGADSWRCLSLSWRAPMREPEKEEKVPVGIPLPDLTMDEFMDVEDGWSTREYRV